MKLSVYSTLRDKLLLEALPFLPDLLARRLLRSRHPFDLRYGTDTDGLLYAPDLPTGHAHDSANEGYYATAPSIFRGLISRWEDTLGSVVQNGVKLRISDYRFIDLGSGKGRVLLLASELPFRAITGVELNAALCATARRNLDRWLRQPRACSQIQVVCGDVLDQLRSLPDGPVVLFLFNSFGAEVMRPLLQRLTEAARTRGAPMDLLYVHPDWAELVERTLGVETLFSGEIPFLREDALADAFEVCSDAVAIYRFGPGV